MISLDQKVGGKIHAERLRDLTVAETVYVPENGRLDIS
jgi:hypothetical protein